MYRRMAGGANHRGHMLLHRSVLSYEPSPIFHRSIHNFSIILGHHLSRLSLRRSVEFCEIEVKAIDAAAHVEKLKFVLRRNRQCRVLVAPHIRRVHHDELLLYGVCCMLWSKGSTAVSQVGL